MDTFTSDVERSAQALAFGMSVEDTAKRLADTQKMPLEEAWLRVKAAEVWLRHQ